MRLASGEPIAAVPNITLAPGEGLLVSGPSGSGKSSLFRALAGLWPLGDGAIRLPARAARMLALPQRPYFPLGTLRQALTYPTLAEAVDDTALRDAWRRPGSPTSFRRLDEEAEWATVLSGGEQQRVAFARALIARPAVLLLDEAVTTLEESEGARALPHAGRASARTRSSSRSAARPLLSALHRRAIVLDGMPASARGARTHGRGAGLILLRCTPALCRTAIWKFYLIATGTVIQTSWQGRAGDLTRC